MACGLHKTGRMLYSVGVVFLLYYDWVGKKKGKVLSKKNIFLGGGIIITHQNHFRAPSCQNILLKVKSNMKNVIILGIYCSNNVAFCGFLII